ncbi:two-component regulator propeller domain-containing protein [Pedobacter aquatilis]|uniref:ligand-binding sensor domain-containing protein n=1 Tax=Pedobacter aquatilis TaxID=351343 RepID=UPI0025B57EB0|nr:sensor histidine kinase [Pedobacter aquatilis]MDN3588535.1 two-component regulator propeller domain-containing protein [Pedobacter aquatilis]
MKKLVLLFSILILAEFCSAQPYYFRHYQVENGLSNNTVFCSAQDENGFMWFGTKDGLNRFDGYQFKTYRYDIEQPGSLGNDLVYDLHKDAEHNLWVGTNKGVYQYIPQKEQFRIIKGTENLRINDLNSDKEGNLWIISLFKIYLYNSKQKKLYAFGKNAAFDANAVSIMNDGSIWISTMQGTIEEYNPKKKVFKSHFVMSKTNPQESSWATRTLDVGNQKILVGTANQGIKLFDRKTGLTKDVLTFNDDKTSIYVRDIIQAANDEFWVATESGVYIYSSKQVTRLKKQYSNPYSLTDNAIYTVFKDRENGIWAGTYFGGVNYYSSQYSIFTKYFPQRDNNAISGSDVREICKDGDGNLWIGTEDAGLNMLNPKTGLFTNLLPNGKSSSISYYNIHGLLVDGNKLWIGTFEHGLDILDIKTKKVIKHYSAGKGNKLRTNFIVSFYKTSKGDILIATISGLYIYDRKNDDFELVPNIPVVFYELITEDANGNIWAGTFNDGVIRFRLDSKDVKQYKNNPKISKSLTHNTINGILQDSKGNIWISTDGGGLNLYNPKEDNFEHITSKDGLPSNFLFRIIEDKDNKLWIGSTRGLIHYNPAQKTVKIYSRSNGLLTDQFNYNSGFRDVDGRIYFGSVRGLISFKPEELKNYAINPLVKLTGFQIDNEESKISDQDSVLKKSILYTDNISLNDSQSSFSIDFAALSYTSPDMTQYAYRMKGLSNKWIHLKTNRKVYFTKLSAGNYVFEVKALINGAANWSENNPRLFIAILPPFYESNLAYLIYAIVLTTLAYYLIRGYHQKMESRTRRRMELFENKKEREIYQAKIEFFTNIAHEIRTPLTLIKGPMEKVIKQAATVPFIEKNLRVMNRNTDRLLKLTNQLLDFRKTEVNGFSLNFVNANISDILNDINIIFQPMAEEKNLMFSLIMPNEPFFAYVDTEAFYKIISNLTDNAIKYGEKLTEIKLLIGEGKPDFFKIEVLNDGPLIAAELRDKIFEPFFRATEQQVKQGTGIGLSISKSLAELHDGNLFATVNAKGQNLFVLELPIHQLIEFNLKGKWKKQ